MARLPWRQRTVPMYDRLVQEPRLVWWWTAEEGPSPLPLLEDVGRALSRRYGREFDSIGCNYYRTGSDSVAWHGDRMRHTQVDPLVATVSVGAPGRSCCDHAVVAAPCRSSSARAICS